MIGIGEKGRLQVEIDVKGSSAHASMPWLGTNALYRLRQVLHQIEGYEPERDTSGIIFDYLSNFAIEDKSSNLNVVYEGIIPDMFKDGQEVVVEGTLAQNGVFHANTLLTSCPSKYEAEREAGKSHPGNIPYPDKNKDVSPKSTGFLPKTTI